MSHRSKSGQKRKQHLHDMRWKRRLKRKKAKLLAEGKIRKGSAPLPKKT